MERLPTIRDVARLAGVGASTVSLALRNDRRLRPAMRARVQQIAKKLGYRPNATVANLMAQLRGSKLAKFQSTLGLLNASEESGILREIPTFQEWTRGVSDRARELGYGLDFFWLHEPGLNPARLRQILETRGIRGLMVTAIQALGVLPEKYAELWPHFSSVVIGMRPQNPALHFAANDQFSTAAIAAAEARGLGYVRPALVLNSKIDAWLEHRFSAGFFAQPFLHAHEMRLPVFDFNKHAEREFLSWYRAHQPDVIVTLHAEIRDWLEAAGINIPQEVGLIHLDRTSGMTDWAGMDQNSYCIGVAATDVIVGQLHRNDQGVPDFPKAVMIQSKWVSGATVRKQSPQARRPRKILSRPQLEAALRPLIRQQKKSPA